MINFIIPGPPVGKGRPRVTRNGTYTPQKTKDYQNLVSMIARTKTKKTLEGPIKAKLTCYYPIPKNMPKYKLAQIEEGLLFPLVKPDVDNVAKGILDALNGICYNDDNQVVELNITKFYSEIPGVDVFLSELIVDKVGDNVSKEMQNG